MTIARTVPLALQEEWTIRHPAMTDLNDVLALMTASDIAEFGEPDYTLDDLRDEWQEIDLAREAWLIFSPEGFLAGYAQVTTRGAYVRIDSDGYVHPDHTGNGVGTTLVQLIGERARQHAALAADGEQVVLNIFINGANRDARALLERLGFSPVRHFDACGSISIRHARRIRPIGQPGSRSRFVAMRLISAERSGQSTKRSMTTGVMCHRRSTRGIAGSHRSIQTHHSGS
jgi:GNAT superfamily N-acetyltransferase